ncbi:Integrator complex subunit 3 [Amphibalanus amphitrite]|uniref:SOSS complex subunit A homolog n=1 Tax=Amphibalanus amphitrite TaxID=1232801 RepID=A0A6A4VM13_AMPAM|nr:Integrator complex subunit 3 [Amphibalanus amphitrite]
MQFLIMEKYTKLLESVKQQLIWLTREMIRNSVNGTEALCWNLMRQIVGGDVSPKNIWLAESLLDIYVENRAWLEKHSFLVASAVYSYLRIMEDHFAPQFQALRQKETTFVVQLLRERFADCMIIGRDLVRLLQHVARIPEVEAVWRDLLHNPTVLLPQFGGLLQLMQTRTSRRFLQCRLTPDMEKKLVFLTSQVRFGMQKRYQEWFQRQYLATTESQSLRCDLIRFIVGVIHPSNELLSSDIIPRWAVIGWLLTTCTSQVAIANAKLALFYDWLFYDAEKDNIMNIEPAVLVMHFSLRPHPAITATLLDFMCRVIPTFYPPLTDRVSRGMFTALHQIIKMRVLPSLSQLFQNPKLDKDLRKMLREWFAEFCTDAVVKSDDMQELGGDSLQSELAMPKSPPGDEATFSDEEDDVSPGSSPVKAEPPPVKAEPGVVKTEPAVVKPPFPPTEQASAPAPAPDESPPGDGDGPERPAGSPQPDDELTEAMEVLAAPLRKELDKLRNETDLELQCAAIERLCVAACEYELTEEENTALSTCLTALCSETLNSNVYPAPDELGEEALEDSISQPLFVLMRCLCDAPEEDPTRQTLIGVLAEMSERSPRLPYLLLHFINVRIAKEEKDTKVKWFGVYKELCHARDTNRELAVSVVEDLKTCQEEEQNLFIVLVPTLFTHLSTACVGNVELMNMIVSSLDSNQLLQLLSHIVQSDLVMFRKDSFMKVLNASLEWETFEQYCLWQLVEAHELTIDYILPLLTTIQSREHAEAVSCVMLMLRREEPCMELVKPLLQRTAEEPHDVFVASVLKYWSTEYEEQTARLIANLINRTSLTPNKRRRNSPRSNLPTTEQILCHLDQMRCALRSASFWSIDEVQTALSVAQSGSNEAQRKRFADLFALIEVEEEARTRRGRKAAARGRATTKSIQKSAETDSDESSEDEEVIKKPTKRRRRNNQLNSDSD